MLPSQVQSKNSTLLLALMSIPPLQHIYNFHELSESQSRGCIRCFIILSLADTTLKELERRNPLEDSFLSIYNLEGTLTKEKKHLLANQRVSWDKKREHKHIHFKVLIF